MAVKAAADLDAITFNDRGVAALDVFVRTDDFVFVDFCAFCECHVRLLSLGPSGMSVPDKFRQYSIVQSCRFSPS